jgi:hypothetical protein
MRRAVRACAVRSRSRPSGTRTAAGEARSRTATHSLRHGPWWGWQLVPGPRDSIIPYQDIAGIPVEARDPGRPDQGSRKGAVISKIGEMIYGSAIDHDPGLLLESGSQYLCESADANDRKTKPFSLYGDPQGDERGDFDLPRCVWARLKIDADKKQSLDVLGNSDDVAKGEAHVSDAPDGSRENDRDGLYVEGDLLAKCRVATLTVTMHETPLSKIPLVGDVIPVIVDYDVATTKTTWPYGLHYEHVRKDSLWNAIVKSFEFFLEVAEVLSGLGVIDIGLTGADGALSPLAQQAAETAKQLEDLTKTGKQSVPSTALDGAALGKLYPPRYRPMGRAVTRRYAKLADLVGAAGELALDGVIECADWSGVTGLLYRGRGVLYTGAPSPRLPATVSAGEKDDTSWLTVHHESRHGDPQGSNMLEIAAGDPKQDGVRASVYASQGVTCDRATTITGNLVCERINKAWIPRDASVTVDYDNAVLRRPDPQAFDADEWRAVVVSPRVCQTVER